MVGRIESRRESRSGGRIEIRKNIRVGGSRESRGGRIESRRDCRVGGRIEFKAEDRAEWGRIKSKRVRLSDLYIVIHGKVAHGLGIRIAVLAVGLQGEA